MLLKAGGYWCLLHGGICVPAPTATQLQRLQQ